MDKKSYWLWLDGFVKISYRKKQSLLKYFQYDLNKIWEADTIELSKIQTLNKEDIFNIQKNKDSRNVELCREKYMENNIEFITLNCSSYSEFLKNIYDPPLVLYYKGKVDLLKARKVAIVGARKCTQYGKVAANKIAQGLSANNICIVSGLARGIDTEAHKGSLLGKGSTIAVLGCGIHHCYPKENSRLMGEIMEKGLIISEYLPEISPKPWHFPNRNRIISGLSEKIIIVEAAKKSGSLITADQALEQGRDVIAVPGQIFSKYSEGSHQLILQGAEIFTSIKKIVGDMQLNEATKNEVCVEQLTLDSTIRLEKYEKMIYDYLSLEPISIHLLQEKLEIPVEIIQEKLTLLEIDDWIVKIEGNRFIRKK